MELRHIRYFIAVAEEGSLKLAAERRLRTSQPSLSRQMRDLESEVGVPLMVRSVRGVALTAAGRVFLDHARLALAQVAAAAETARRTARPSKPVFAIGFLSGHEVDCLPAATAILKETLAHIDLRVSSGFSTTLAEDLAQGKLDIAFLRREPYPEIDYRLIAKEPLVAVLSADHPLASREQIDPRDLVGQTFIGVSDVPRLLKGVINDYLDRSHVELVPHLEIDNFAMAVSLIKSERAVAVLPASVEDYLLPSVCIRKLKGEQPTIDLMLGYQRSNSSPYLVTFLERIDELSAHVRREARCVN